MHCLTLWLHVFPNVLIYFGQGAITRGGGFGSKVDQILTPNWTNPGLFQIRFQYIWLDEPQSGSDWTSNLTNPGLFRSDFSTFVSMSQMYWNLIWKSPGFVQFGVQSEPLWSQTYNPFPCSESRTTCCCDVKGKMIKLLVKHLSWYWGHLWGKENTDKCWMT